MQFCVPLPFCQESYLRIKPHLHAPKVAPPPHLFLATQFCVFIHTGIYIQQQVILR